MVIDLDHIARFDPEAIPIWDDNQGRVGRIELVSQDAAETDDRIDARGNDCGRSGAVVDGFQKDAASGT